MKRHKQTTETGIFGKLLTLVTGAILLAAGLLFSVVILAILAVVALMAGAYIWWKTRKLRQVMKEQTSYGQVIDGEVVVVDEATEAENRSVLPQDALPR